MGNYCSRCGKALPEGTHSCPECGQAVGGTAAGANAVPPPAAQRRLMRPRAGRMVAGVCQGVSQFYGWDVTVVRVVFVLLTFFSLIGLIGYVVLWLTAPEEPYGLPPVQSPVQPSVQGYPPR